MIYLNNAATSYPKPDCVGNAMERAVMLPPGSGNRGGLESFDIFGACREKLAVLMGISNPEGIALGANATWGLNMGILGFPFKAGDVVLTTKAEHNSVLRPLYRLEHGQGPGAAESEGTGGDAGKNSGGYNRGNTGENTVEYAGGNTNKNSGDYFIRVIYLDTDEYGRVRPEDWKDALYRYNPVLSVFTHASNVTGAVNNAPLLAAMAKEAGSAVLIDASQTLGFIPMEAEKWGADMVCFTGHKYLLGPQGTGGIWVREGLELSPVLLGGTGIMSDLDTMPREMPIHLEAGTGNEPSFHGLLAALEWSEKNPIEYGKIEARVEKIRECLTAQGFEVIIPPGLCTPVISFYGGGMSAEETGYMLMEGSDIVCRTGLHCAPKIFDCIATEETVRLSLSRFTTDEEAEEVCGAIEALRF